MTKESLTIPLMSHSSGSALSVQDSYPLPSIPRKGAAQGRTEGSWTKVAWKTVGVSCGVVALLAITAFIFSAVREESTFRFSFISLPVSGTVSLAVSALYSASYYWFQPSRSANQLFLANCKFATANKAAQPGVDPIPEVIDCTENKRNVVNCLGLILAVSALTYIITSSVINKNYVELLTGSLPVLFSIGCFSCELVHANEITDLRNDQKRILASKDPSIQKTEQESIQLEILSRQKRLKRIKFVAKTIALLSLTFFALYIARSELSFNKYLPNTFYVVSSLCYFSWLLFDLAKNSKQVFSARLLATDHNIVSSESDEKSKNYIKKFSRAFIYTAISSTITIIAILAIYQYFANDQSNFLKTIIGESSLTNASGIAVLAGYSWLQLSALREATNGKERYLKMAKMKK